MVTFIERSGLLPILDTHSIPSLRIRRGRLEKGLECGTGEERVCTGHPNTPHDAEEKACRRKAAG